MRCWTVDSKKDGPGCSGWKRRKELGMGGGDTCRPLPPRIVTEGAAPQWRRCESLLKRAFPVLV